MASWNKMVQLKDDTLVFKCSGVLSIPSPVQYPSYKCFILYITTYHIIPPSPMSIPSPWPLKITFVHYFHYSLVLYEGCTISWCQSCLKEMHTAALGGRGELRKGLVFSIWQAVHIEWYEDGATQWVRMAGVWQGKGITWHWEEVESTCLGLSLPWHHL